MADSSIKEGTTKRVDVKYRCKINLPADTPSGHPHIIKWNAGVDRNKVPQNLFTVDVIATILYELNPSALSRLLDVQARQFYCWWETNGHIKEPENDKEYQNETVDSESKEYGDLLLDYIHVHRVGQVVQVRIVSSASGCSNLEVTYAICDEGNWEIVASQAWSHDNSNRGYYRYTSSPDLCKAHDQKLARIIIRGTDFEDKKDMQMDFHWECGLENAAGTPKYSRRKTQNISNAGRITGVSQQVQESEIGSGGSSRFVDEMSEVQGRLDKLQKSVEELTSSLKKRKRDD